MVEQVVWFEGQERSKVREFFRVANAVRFHYMRMLFGPQYGMKGAAA